MLEHLYCFRAFDHTDQLASIEHLEDFVTEHPRIKLILIDSVAFHFRYGFKDMSERGCGRR